jgi:hypothetical protein
MFDTNEIVDRFRSSSALPLGPVSTRDRSSGRTAVPIRTATAAIVCALVLLFPNTPRPARAQGREPGGPKATADRLGESFRTEVQPLLRKYCFECHSGDLTEADVDFESFSSLESVRKNLPVWQRAGEMLQSRQMPPKKAKKPSEPEYAALEKWVNGLLVSEAAAHAGDPGRVVLRRLDNVEYTWTIRDLTGVPSLDPAKEFPVDGAAGEGFTNTGNALVMSPALLTKYLDAGKAIAAHAVLLPDGIRFSPSTSRRDWSEEALTRIRDFYARFTESGGGAGVNLQGIQFTTNAGGLLPLKLYLTATITHRDELADGRLTIEQLAAQAHLNAKYLGLLYDALTGKSAESHSLLIATICDRWKTAKPEDVDSILGELSGWQKALWKFNPTGHIARRFGRKDGPEAWMEMVDPLVARQDFRLKLAAPPGQKSVTLYLSAADGGDGNEHDFVLWENPRLVAPGRPDLPLRDLRAFVAALDRKRDQVYSSVAACLSAASQAGDGTDQASIAKLAERFKLDPVILAAWLEYLGLAAGEARIDSLFTRQLQKSEAYDFIKAWVAEDALGVIANSSDEHVRIPGNMKPHSIAVHPSPARSVVVGWRSPVAEPITLEGSVQHAHPECGNGITWTVEVRRGKTRQRLAGGATAGTAVVSFGPLPAFAVKKGDLVVLLIGPRDGNHSCDLTAIDLNLKGSQYEWNLARDVSPNILAGNPHADSRNNPAVWNFGSEPDRGGSQWIIPSGSLLAHWQSATTSGERQKLANDLESLIKHGTDRLAKNSPDAALYHQLTSLSGPLLSAVRNSIASSTAFDASGQPQFGLDPARFGKHPSGQPVDPRSLCVQAPSTIRMTLPADLVDGCEFVTSGTLHPDSRQNGSVQLSVQTSPPGAQRLDPTSPIVVNPGSPARERFETAFRAERSLFPPVLCYSRIVPVDEVVTLNLFYRQDEHLERLMLNARQVEQLNRMWDELIYVSQEPFLMATVFEQIYEFATQDRPDMVKAFEPMRGPMNDYVKRFRERLVATEPAHFRSLLAFAARAYRRPLTDSESRTLTDLYKNMRKEGAAHDEALRLTLARVLVAPAFLYRVELPGNLASQQRVSSYELASRLSYFLWSSTPDQELLELASRDELKNAEVLKAQMRRMVRDAKASRLASEFCAQWLHIHDFDQHDEKSERHFPTFSALKSAMYEESLRFLTDLFQNDRPILELLDCDHTFLNEALAEHYGIRGVKGARWRRVDGVRQYGRGGILAQATTLAKQSGASRTSPILRGNWLSEVILGEKLPRPPKNVPQLPETAPQGLTERQLVERHTTDVACAKCHARIDPLGFALENYDAIGRYRGTDAAGLAIDSKTKLQDGTRLDGLTGLQNYLVKDRREAFIRQFDRKLLGFALGRAVQLSDETLLSEMKSALENNGYRVSVAIEAVVLSRQFREVRSRDHAENE